MTVVPAVKPRAVPGTLAEWIDSGEWKGTIETSMPMLPAMANQVIQLAIDPDVPASRFTAVVAKDPVLATRIIRLANSAYSAPVIEISTINDAVVRMGTRAVRNVVFAVCLTSRMRDPAIYGKHGKELIDHSVGTAYLANLLAYRTGESPDEAFLWGLLHDIGKLLILKLAHDYTHLSGAPATDEEVAALIDERHAALGGYLLRQWRLPTSLDEPIICHHQPGRAEHAPKAAATLYVANRLAHRYGFGCPKDDFDPLADPMCLAIGLDERWLEKIDEKAPGLFDVARRVVD